MNMHQPIQADPSPTAARLHEAWKARRAKEAAAARRVQTANQNAPAVKREPEPRDVESFGAPKVSLELRTAPLWRIAKLKFDAHVTAWNDWKAEVFATQGAPLKAYIRRRSHELGFTYSDVTGPSRRQDITDARQLIMWEIKTLLRPGARGEPDFVSYPEIGRLFGGRDHTTTLHAVRKIQAMKDKGQI